MGVIRVYKDNIANEAYIEGITSGYSYNYYAWDSAKDKISIRNKNTGIEEVHKIPYYKIVNEQGTVVGDKTETIDYLNNEVFTEIAKIRHYFSDIKTSDEYYYYGYEYSDNSIKIIRVKKDNILNQKQAQNISNLNTDWNNRQSLNYT